MLCCKAFSHCTISNSLFSAMKFSAMNLLPLATLVSVATAHVHLAYPPPRGPFVANQEPTFCGRFPPYFPYLLSADFCFPRRLPQRWLEPYAVPA